MILLCIFSSDAKDGAARGMRLCAAGLIPSLFPFLVAGQLLAGGAGKFRLTTPLCRLLCLTPAEYACFWLGQIGGYPMGACLLAEGVNNGTIDRHRAKKLVPCFVGCGPGFALSALRKGAGILVFICCVVANLLCIKLTKLPPAQTEKSTPPVADPVDSVQKGCFAMINICANVVIFCTGKQILARLLPLFSPLWAFLEVGSGVFELTQYAAPLPVFGALLGFGGFSVARQVKMAANGLCGMGRIVVCRAMAGAAAAGLVWCVQRLLPESVLACSAPAVQIFSPGVNIWCAASLALFFVSAGAALLSPLQEDKTLIK